MTGLSEALPLLFGIVLVATAAAYALLPLVGGTPAAETTVSSDLSAERSLLYRQVLDLEFDRRTGKLTDEDFRQLEAELLARAAGLLRADAVPGDDIEAEVEREIAAARAAFAASRERVAATATDQA